MELITFESLATVAGVSAAVFTVIQIVKLFTDKVQGKVTWALAMALGIVFSLFYLFVSDYDNVNATTMFNAFFAGVFAGLTSIGINESWNKIRKGNSGREVKNTKYMFLVLLIVIIPFTFSCSKMSLQTKDNIKKIGIEAGIKIILPTLLDVFLSNGDVANNVNSVCLARDIIEGEVIPIVSKNKITKGDVERAWGLFIKNAKLSAVIKAELTNIYKMYFGNIETKKLLTLRQQDNILILFNSVADVFHGICKSYRNYKSNSYKYVRSK